MLFLTTTGKSLKTCATTLTYLPIVYGDLVLCPSRSNFLFGAISIGFPPLLEYLSDLRWHALIFLVNTDPE
ncbi:hypothetical protein V8E51_010225 [Hyaloscypha variabilis]